MSSSVHSLSISNQYSMQPLLDTDPYEGHEYNELDADLNIQTRKQKSSHDGNIRCRCCRGGCRMKTCTFILFISSIVVLVLGVLLTFGIYVIVPMLIKSQLKSATLDFQLIQTLGIPSDSVLQLHSVGTVGNIWNLKTKLHQTTLYLYATNSSTNTAQYTSLSSTSSSSSPLSSTLPLPSDDSSDSSLEMCSMIFPDITFDGATNFSIYEPLVITSSTNFNYWVRNIIFSPIVTWTVKSSCTVTPTLFGIDLPTFHGLEWDKTVSETGCAGLPNVQLISFDFLNSTNDAILINAVISMYNPSPFELTPIGALHYQFYYLGVYQGDFYSLDNNTNLSTGLNYIHFTGRLNPSLNDWNYTRDLTVRYLTGQESVIEAYPAEKDGSSIPLYNQAISGLKIATPLQGLANNSLIQSVGIIGATLTPSTTDTTVTIEMDIWFIINSPLGQNCSLDAESILMDTLFSFVDADSNEIIPVGHLVQEESAMLEAYNVNGTKAFRGQVNTTLVLQQPFQNYQVFLHNLINRSDQIQLFFNGTSAVTAKYLYGHLEIPALAVNIALSVAGAGGLKHVNKAFNITGDRTCNTAEDEYCGVNISVMSDINNPTIFSVSLTNAWFDVVVSNDTDTDTDVRLGSIQIEQLVLSPGMNSDITTAGYLNPASSALPTMSAFMSNYLAGSNQTIALQGTVLNHPNQPSAQDYTVESMKLFGTIMGKKLFLLDNFKVKSLVLDVSTLTAPTASNNGTVATAGIVTADISLPSNFHLSLNVTSSDLSFEIVFDDGGVGLLSVPRIPIMYEAGSNTSIILEIAVSTLTIGDMNNIEQFAVAMITTKGLNIDLVGVANPWVQTNMGLLQLQNVHQTAAVSLIGFNDFFSIVDDTPLLNMISLDITGSHMPPAPAPITNQLYDGETIFLQCNVSLDIASQISVLNAGVLAMDMYYQGVRLATIKINDFSITTGLNIYQHDNCQATFWSPLVFNQNYTNRDYAIEFLSLYLNGYGSDLSFSGMVLLPDGTSTPGTNITLFQPAFHDFSSWTHIGGNPTPFVQEIIVEFNISTVLQIILDGGGMVPAMAKLYNPFSLPITVTDLTMTVYAGNLTAPEGGYLITAQPIAPIWVPPRQGVYSPWLPIYLILNPSVYACLAAVFLNNVTAISLSGQLNVWINTEQGVMPDPTNTVNQTMKIMANLIPTTVYIAPTIESNQNADIVVPDAAVASEPSLLSSAHSSVVDQFLNLYESLFDALPPGTCPITKTDTQLMQQQMQLLTTK